MFSCRVQTFVRFFLTVSGSYVIDLVFAVFLAVVSSRFITSTVESAITSAKAPLGSDLLYVD